MTKQDFLEKMEELKYSKKYSNNLISWMEKGNNVYIKWSCNHFAVELNDAEVTTNAKGIIQMQIIKGEIEWWNSETNYLDPDTNEWEEWTTEVGGEWYQDVDTLCYHE